MRKGYIQCYLKTAGIILAESGVVQSLTESGADAGFQVRGGALVFRVKNHNFTPKKINFSSILGGGGRVPGAPPSLDPPWECLLEDDCSTICAGRLFQILMVSRKKDLWYIKVLANGIWDHACVFPHMSKMPTFQLNLKVGILLICEKHLHDRIISLESRFGHMKLVYN